MFKCIKEYFKMYDDDMLMHICWKIIFPICIVTIIFLLIYLIYMICTGQSINNDTNWMSVIVVT